MNPFRAIRRLLAGASARATRPAVAPPFARQTAAWARASLLIRAYYFVLCYFAVSLLPSWEGFLHANPAALSPLWPVAWLRHVPFEEGVAAILWLYLGGTVAAALRPESRAARFAAWLGLFEFVAFNNSFGKIGHSLHAWVLTGLALVLLPAWDAGRDRGRRQRFLQVFWLAQAVLLLIYTMAGLSKLIGCVYQLAQGQMSLLDPRSFSYQVAGRLLETNSRSSWGAWFIVHPYVGWLFYLGMVYVQVCAFWAAFRPRLLWAWGVALLLFHVGSYFVFTIIFAPSVVLVGLLLLAAPQARAWDLGPRLWGALPGLGRLARRLLPGLFAEGRCAS